MGLGRLGNAWIFKAGGLLCSKSLLFGAWKGWGVNEHFGGPIEEKVSDLGGLEGLEGLEMHGFSWLEGVSDSAMAISVAL